MLHYSATDLSDTIVALSTPQGLGAIGVIRLSGNQAITLCNEVFFGKDLTQQKTHTLHFGTLRDGTAILDEVVVALFCKPHSYTTDDVVEISCHGSPYILQEVIQLFIRKGARLAKPGEFTMRAFLNGRMDLSQAEAVADLIASESESAHQIAMKQMRGGFSKQISQLRQQLIDFASLIELELDFGEEDVAFADRTQLITLIKEIRSLLQQLIHSFKLGNALKNGIATVIAGRPNAGKSTLLNALLNEDRAIVSAIAGTTRDTIEEQINLEGIPFRFIDTAGIREAGDTIEAIGIKKTFEKITQSSLVVYIFDPNEMTLKEVQTELDKLDKSDIQTLVVGNKMDLLSEAQVKEITTEGKTHFGNNFLLISATEVHNIEDLKQYLIQVTISDKVQLENPIVTNVRHFDALEQADASLSTVLQNIEADLSGELLALDIRQALHHLGEITGEVTTDDLLGNIFGKFCIGK